MKWPTCGFRFFHAPPPIRHSIRACCCRKPWLGTTWKKILPTSKRTTTSRPCSKLVVFQPRRFSSSNSQCTFALKIQPDNFDAHYNLANALASKGKFLEAIEHYRAAIRLHPDDANAEANLGSALAETGKLSEAKLHFQRALQINPNHKLARENLEQITRDLKNLQE